jgi:hypothetical protein
MLEILKKFFFHRGENIMSILEKLKDLVTALETGESQKREPKTTQNGVETEEIDTPSEQEEPILEESDLHEEETTEEEVEEEEAIEEVPSYLECSEEETLRVTERLDAIKAAKASLADLVISFEQKKAQLLRFVGTSTNEFYGELNSLRLEYGVPEEGYTVSLPSSPSDKVSFTKD